MAEATGQPKVHRLRSVGRAPPAGKPPAGRKAAEAATQIPSFLQSLQRPLLAKPSIAPARTGEMFAGSGSSMTRQQRRLGWGQEEKAPARRVSVLQSLWKMWLFLLNLNYYLLDGPVIPHSGI